jgi:hypothetical protein
MRIADDRSGMSVMARDELRLRQQGRRCTTVSLKPMASRLTASSNLPGSEALIPNIINAVTRFHKRSRDFRRGHPSPPRHDLHVASISRLTSRLLQESHVI